MIKQSRVTVHFSPQGTMVLQMPVSYTGNKRLLIHKLIMESPNFEDVYCYNTSTGKCGYCSDNFEAVPDELIDSVVMASVNPVSNSLVLGLNKEDFKRYESHLRIEYEGVNES